MSDENFLGSWVERVKFEWENCERRKLAGCKKCIVAKIMVRCLTPKEWERIKEATMKEIKEETIRKIAEEKIKLVKARIRNILKKSIYERNWIERRYLELWLPTK